MGLTITLTLGALIAAIAALHFSWALGAHWPAPKGQPLAIYVTPGTRWPGRAITLAVALAIGAAAGVVLASRAKVPAPWDMLAAGAYFVVTLVFLGRGLAGYFPALWRRAEGLPFHRLNRAFYSPLCLAIGAGLAINVLIT
ncbi:DUF3995 domain-containing protein [Phenylobacterium sp.]|uniref:DUF3995 domain-containing protein n=1 Tax=Phenylobacterium sp. TaxID=1871053 RepID=UPI002BA226E4|nr:DUF3995 domain-containing protein [Phenylobacterium sp.]HLZ73916.1 DUF3995 domain-containing protein [Phenylobacterium sp.]